MAGVIVFLAIIFLIVLFSSFFIVRQQTMAIVERFGRFHKVSSPGLRMKVPIVDRIAGRLSLRIQQLDVRIETKTKDNVFVNVVASVQYHVIESRVTDAFYRLQSPQAQITSYIYDVVRARVPVIKLDDVFETKDDIAKAVRTELASIMDDFGYGIVKALVTDIDPDANVKTSMNRINAAQRLRVAAVEEAEAEKIKVVKAAEAEAESKALQGKGIADQRTAIVNGLQESVSDFQEGVAGTSAQDVMNLVLMTQYFDTLKDIGLSSKTNTILVPHSPGGMSGIADQLREAMITANTVTDVSATSKPKSGPSPSSRSSGSGGSSSPRGGGTQPPRSSGPNYRRPV